MSTSLNSLRTRARKVGLKFSKSNWRKDSIDNLGGYQVVDDSRNVVVDGARFDCTLADVEACIRREEAAA